MGLLFLSPFIVKSKNNLSIIRPPGAKNENEFLNLCIRCGQCMKICPTQVIELSLFERGLTGIYAPRLIFTKGWCEMCSACGCVCPTGAIKKITKPTKIGIAKINKNRCIGWARGGLCLICVEVCPYQGVTSDKKHRPHVVLDKCIGCGLCEYNCPVSPRAIYVVGLFK